jgi:hypothetical protein
MEFFAKKRDFHNNFYKFFYNFSIISHHKHKRAR